MYTDLKQYISTQKCKVKKYTYGWYVKQFCEYSNNAAYVNDLMLALKLAFTHGYDMNDINLFDDLIDDYHVQDTLDVGDNIMLKIILSCFVDDFILEADNRCYFSQFMEYSKTAQIALGKKPDFLAEWLENHFSDFAHIVDEECDILTVERLVNEMRMEYSDLEEINEETYMTSAILVIDENAENIIECETLLDILNFTEVVPGFYYTGTVSYGGCLDNYYSLNSTELEEIMDLLKNMEKQRELDDEIFCKLNMDRFDKVERLAQGIKYCSSHREVMF